MYIPELDLPKQLVTLLRATLEDNVTKNWTIYSENNGDLVFKIRFEAMESATHDVHVAPIPTSHFKRKSTGQVKRDQHRYQKWRDTHGQHQGVSVNSNVTQQVTAGIQTRSKSRAISTPEQVRGSDTMDSDNVVDIAYTSLASPLHDLHDSTNQCNVSRDQLICVNNVCLTPVMPVQSITKAPPDLPFIQVDDVPQLHRYHSSIPLLTRSLLVVTQTVFLIQ